MVDMATDVIEPHHRPTARGRASSSLGRRARRRDRPVRRRARPRRHVRHRGLRPAAVVGLPGASPSPRSSAAGARRSARSPWPSAPSPSSCGSTALASAMHQHVTLFTAWRYRRGLPGAEATLRRIADEGIILVSTGGADFTRPRGTARAVDGGFRVSAQGLRQPGPRRRRVLDDVRARRRRHEPVVLNMAVPVQGRRRDRPRQLGHPRHARHGEPRRRRSRTCSCPRSRCSPGGRGASSTRRCR